MNSEFTSDREQNKLYAIIVWRSYYNLSPMCTEVLLTVLEP